jgi:hypothetical protein
MSYYIYENWQAGPHKAVVHRGSCGYYKDGRGVRGGTDPRHGRWHGPYSSLDAARQAAGRLANVVVQTECRCV